MENAKKIMKSYMPEMINTISEAIKYNTVQKPKDGIYPFGKDTAMCLDYLLDLCKKFGFETYNCDYYAGHADFGDGEEVLGILGHIDVVPVSETGWKHPPFSGEVSDGRIWGRGAIDDKAPIITCLYAMKALKDAGYKPNKKIRIIFGCDEENGMECIKHYKTKVRMPDIAFTPDAEFPCVNGEKGICGSYLNFGKLPEKLLEFYAGDRINVVPDECTIVVDKSVNIEPIKNMDLIITECDKGYKIVGKGVSVHGSLPETGKNAIWGVLRALHILFPENATISFMQKLIVDTDAKAWFGVALKDKHSALSMSLDRVRITDDHCINAGIDIRFPVTMKSEEIIDYIIKNSPAGTVFIDKHVGEPLFIEPDSMLVRTFVDAYNKATGENKKSLVIGGGTYAKSMPNCIGAGPEFAGDEQTMHQTNEYISLHRVEQMADIYLDAIYALSK